MRARACVRACVRACIRVCVRVCVCVCLHNSTFRLKKFFFFFLVDPNEFLLCPTKPDIYFNKGFYNAPVPVLPTHSTASRQSHNTELRNTRIKEQDLGNAILCDK